MASLVASSAAVFAVPNTRALRASRARARASRLQRPAAPAAVAAPEREAVQAPAAQAPAAPPAGPSGRVVLESRDELTSTMEHRLWVGTTFALMGTTLGVGLGQVHDGGDAAGAAVAFFLGYVLSDLGTGVYHWAVDNYGSGSTPFFGSQIAAFQGHHQRPWTITEREFCNNVHQVFKPAAPIALALAVAAPFLPGWWDVWAATMLGMACMSQQFHAWSHMKKSELPGAIVALQDAGLLISRKDHGAHHKAPFEGWYCIVSGWWNEVLDQGGSDQGAFRRAERFIAERTGVEPRCWYPPQQDWEEMTRPGR